MEHQEYLPEHRVHFPPQGLDHPPEKEEATETALVSGPYWSPWGWGVIWLPSDGVARSRYFPSHRPAAVFAEQIATRLLIDEWCEDCERISANNRGSHRMVSA